MRLVSWGTGLCLMILLVASIWFSSYILTPSTTDSEITVYIPKGAGLRKIMSLLSQKGLINNDIRFLALARVSGKAKRLRAGEFIIPPHRKPLEILNILEKGDVVLHQVTIPEGLTIRQVGSILEKEEWVDPEQFYELTHSKKFIKSLGLQLDNLEGYLFPDTYSLARGEVSEQSIIRMMVDRFFQVWDEVASDQAPDLVRDQIIVLASIIEKESATPEERPLIARVFLNRLEKKMRLQSDPTVIYGIDKFSGNLTRDDLSRKTPYNTYTITGLPPGPICNPGKGSIMAVLRPADAPYLYFVSKNDGTHYFSTTLKEHNRAVRKYQKSRTKNGKKNQGNISGRTID